MKMLLFNFYLSLYYCLIFSGNAAAHEEIEDPQWVQFKRDFGKSYGNSEEESSGYETFIRRLDEITEHNKKYEAGLVNWQEGLNQYSDVASEEFDSFPCNVYDYETFEY